jgi:hypothetical protein
MIIYNEVGIAICAIGFGIAFAIAHFLFHFSVEGLVMVIGGPLIAALDAIYRLKFGKGHWLSARGGGGLFFLPVWAFGLLWLVLGVVYLIKRA